MIRAETRPDTKNRLDLQASRMTRQYVLALSMLALLIVVRFILMQCVLHIHELQIRLNELTTEQSRLFTDISSMTRGLMRSAASGEVPEDSLNDLRSRIKDNTGRVRANMTEILQIDQDRFLGIFTGGAVSRLFWQEPFPLAKKLDKFLSRADEIASSETMRLRNRLQQWSPIDVVVSSGTLMQNDFDEVMRNSFKMTQQDLVWIRIVEAFISAAALLLIFAEGLYIFAPLVRRVRSEHEQTILHQDMLHQQSRLDGLTGLGNRLAFQEQLLLHIEEARKAETSLGLILFDLDRFKPVNDSLGHPAGDALLTKVAERAKEAAGPNAFIARLGGDEFGILSKDAADDESTRRVVSRVKLAIEQTVIYESHEILPHASFGGAILTAEAFDSPDWLFGAADTALYKAKQLRLGFALLDDTMKSEAAASKQLALDFKLALSRSDLDVFYQPQVRLVDNLIVGFEALIRWHHPERGLLSPGLFLPAAERYGLMTQLTAFVINRVSDDIKRWIETGHEPGIIAINMPEAMLVTGLARQTIDQAMERNGLHSSRISVEVTEDVLLNRNAEQIADALSAMRTNGVRVSFDDFGTGYASLSHLKSFPLDEIKIDRSFINDLLKEESSAEIVSSLIKLAGKLKKTVVAEGIETAEQLQFLVREGCHIGQGYFFSRPVPFDEASMLIALKRIDTGDTRAAMIKARPDPMLARAAV